MTSLLAAQVVTPTEVLSPGEVVIEGGQIAAVRPVSGLTPDRTLTPGFVDLQVNGHDDVDATAAAADLERLDRLLLAQGVTTWCAALTTRGRADTDAALERMGEARTRAGSRPTCAGVHLEGPFLAEAHAGAHPREHITLVDRGWLDGLPPIVRIVTMAPELPGASDAIAALAERGVVVALGHSGADFTTATRAIDAGARMVTHVFNAMRPLHHRDPGIVGCALADDRVVASVIAEGAHLHPAVLATVFQAKGPGRTVLVTDAVAWRAPHLRETLDLVEGAPRRRDGALVGSALTMECAVRNAIEAGVPLADAVAAATAAPAAVLGLEDRGRLEIGTRADLVALAPDGSVEAVWVAGELAYEDAG